MEKTNDNLNTTSVEQEFDDSPFSVLAQMTNEILDTIGFSLDSAITVGGILPITRQEINYTISDFDNFYTGDVINLLLYSLSQTQDLFKIYFATSLEALNIYVTAIGAQNEACAFIPLNVAYNTETMNIRNHWVAIVIDIQQQLMFFLDPAPSNLRPIPHEVTELRNQLLAKKILHDTPIIVNTIDFQANEQNWLRHCGVFVIELFKVFFENRKNEKTISGGSIANSMISGSISLEAALSVIPFGEIDSIKQMRLQHVQLIYKLLIPHGIKRRIKDQDNFRGLIGFSFDNVLALADSEEILHFEASNRLKQTKVEKTVINDAIIDSISRLFEGRSECAAAIFLEKTFFITTNLSEEKGNHVEHDTLLTRIATYLKNPLGEDRELLFIDMCLPRIAKEKGKVSLGPKEKSAERLSFIAKKLLVDHKNWTKNSIAELAKELKIELNLSSQLMSSIVSAYVIISRLSHDFKKVEDFFSRNEKLELKVIKFDGVGVHAELRLIGYLFSNEAGEKGLRKYFTQKREAESESVTIRTVSKFTLETNYPRVYFGISLLCCGGCMRVIKAINEVFQDELGNSEDDAAIIGVAGYHGLEFDSWVMPSFLNIAIKGRNKSNDRLLISIREKLNKFISANYPGRNVVHLTKHGMFKTPTPSTRSSTSSYEEELLSTASNAELMAEVRRRIHMETIELTIEETRVLMEIERKLSIALSKTVFEEGFNDLLKDDSENDSSNELYT